MITYENGIFSLQGEGFTCLLRVNQWKLLEQLYFGPAVAASDWEAFACQPGIGWGSSVLLETGNPASCPDAMPLAWSGSGRGDYRESPLEVGVATDLRYESHSILEAPEPMSCGLPCAGGKGEQLRITLSQEGLKLHLYFGIFGGVLTRRTVLENTGDAPVGIHKCMSFLMDLPGNLQMTTFDGGWIAEMGKHTAPVSEHRIVNESTTGASSNRHNPGFLLAEPDATEDAGWVYGFNLIYSGNHYASAQRSLQGFNRVMQGISPDNFLWELNPGEKFETPEAAMAVSDRGFGGISALMHKFVLEHIIPAYWQYRERPVLYNDWEGCMFDFNQRKLLNLAKQAKELGCELFVLDDGWFGKRDNDLAGLGDYNVNKKKLPQGIKGLSERINHMGLEFGLWFEPEAVNPDSDLFRAHPDWALTDAFPAITGRNELLLDLTQPQVRDYIVQSVTEILDNANISYVKWDMNRHSIALGAKAHRFVLGLYEVLGRIFGPRPHILLESCSSGGNRFDLGMLCFGPQIWCSDNTDPISRLEIQENLSYLYPQSTFGAHVSASPHAQTLRTTPLATRGNVSFFGCLGYELDLDHLLPVEQKEIKEQIALYKKYRSVFQFGVFSRLQNGWQVQKGKTTIAGVFRRLTRAAAGYEQLRLKHLDGGKRYAFGNRPQELRIGQFGSLVKHVLPVNLNPNGAILRTADRHMTMHDGIQELTASGAALMNGVTLLPLFRGTGYSEQQRTLLDFGSEVYIAQEVSHDKT